MVMTLGEGLPDMKRFFMGGWGGGGTGLHNTMAFQCKLTFLLDCFSGWITVLLSTPTVYRASKLTIITTLGIKYRIFNCRVKFKIYPKTKWHRYRKLIFQSIFLTVSTRNKKISVGSNVNMTWF
jgi:hypothetical protein